MTRNPENEFEREKVCYEQNFEHARGLNAQMNQIPTLAMTLTGGLWFAAGVTEALKPGGAFYVSFKQGEGERVSPDGRRFTNMTVPALQSLLRSLDQMRIREVWAYTGERASGEGETWINAIATRKSDGSGILAQH